MNNSFAFRSSDVVVVDTRQSTRARLRPIPLSSVELRDQFWEPRLRTNRQTTLASQHRFFEETGRLHNFRRAAGKIEGPFQGLYFNDSDVYKWIEAVAWTVTSEPDPTLSQLMESVVDLIAAAQQPDGYLNTYFMFENVGQRWGDLPHGHELYCAGHLIQAAVAHHRATGSRKLLDTACRFADLICKAFGPAEEGKLALTDGHPEIEMALVELARETGDDGYRKQAAFFLDIRGHGSLGGDAGLQDHQPFRDLDRMIGHAVRAVYLNAGAADLLADVGDETLQTALERLWNNMTQRQMYISGGIGSRYAGEAFGNDYELPNERAYAETCAAIGNVMWNWRMLALSGESRFADVMETALYNGVLSGVSLDGECYFYQNPLADDGRHRRTGRFGCYCCPPNMARLLASLPGYFYSTSHEGIWVHLYAQSEAHLTLFDGAMVKVSQHTRYPWNGDVEIQIEGAGKWSLFLRVPGWCETGALLKINNSLWEGVLTPGNYVEIRRAWQAGDVVQLHLPMPVQMVQSHPHVMENVGRVALMRGPLLFCAEAADNPGIPLRDVRLQKNAKITEEIHHGLGNHAIALRLPAQVECLDEGWNHLLYRTRDGAVKPTSLDTELVAIPYYLWANREAGAMQVWFKESAHGG